MADYHGDAAGNPAMDYAEHERTYRGFIALVKWSTIAMIVLLVGMAVTLL